MGHFLSDIFTSIQSTSPVVGAIDVPVADRNSNSGGMRVALTKLSRDVRPVLSSVEMLHRSGPRTGHTPALFEFCKSTDLLVESGLNDEAGSIVLERKHDALSG